MYRAIATPGSSRSARTWPGDAPLWRWWLPPPSSSAGCRTTLVRGNACSGRGVSGIGHQHYAKATPLSSHQRDPSRSKFSRYLRGCSHGGQRRILRSPRDLHGPAHSGGAVALPQGSAVSSSQAVASSRDVKNRVGHGSVRRDMSKLAMTTATRHQGGLVNIG